MEERINKANKEKEAWLRKKCLSCFLRKVDTYGIRYALINLFFSLYLFSFGVAYMTYNQALLPANIMSIVCFSFSFIFFSAGLFFIIKRILFVNAFSYRTGLFWF